MAAKEKSRDETARTPEIYYAKILHEIFDNPFRLGTYFKEEFPEIYRDIMLDVIKDEKFPETEDIEELFLELYDSKVYITSRQTIAEWCDYFIQKYPDEYLRYNDVKMEVASQIEQLDIDITLSLTPTEYYDKYPSKEKFMELLEENMTYDKVTAYIDENCQDDIKEKLKWDLKEEGHVSIIRYEYIRFDIRKDNETIADEYYEMFKERLKDAFESGRIYSHLLQENVIVYAVGLVDVEHPIEVNSAEDADY